MFAVLVTRRGRPLWSCFQRCASRRQLLHSWVRSTESTMSRPRCMFATSCPQLAAKKKKKKSKSSSKPAQTGLPHLQPYQPYRIPVNKLALSPSPTLLFRASSHRGFLLGCYTLGGLCFCYAAINMNYFYFNPPEDIWTPLPSVIRGLAVFMVGVGMFFIYRPVRMVRTITAVPSPSKSNPHLVLLRIEAQPMVPLKQLKSIMVPPGDVTLLSPLYQSHHRSAFIEDEKRRRRFEKMRELNRKEIMTSPFRLMGHFLRKLFRFFKIVFTSERFALMRIKGKGVWKLNTSAAWALEGGKPFDNMINHTH